MKFLLAMSLLVLGSCNQSELSDEEKGRIAAEVRTMLLQYDDAVRSNGLLAEFAYLDSSKDFFWVPPGYSSSLSYDSVAAIMRQNAKSFRGVDNVRESLRIIPHSRFLATFTGTIRSKLVDTTGKVTTVRLIETGLAVKRNDGWKLLSGQTSLIR